MVCDNHRSWKTILLYKNYYYFENSFLHLDYLRIFIAYRKREIKKERITLITMMCVLQTIVGTSFDPDISVGYNRPVL
jgi:hypothetical protein